MEAADPISNSSQVIVQCHDPSDLFEQLSARLEPRLPLSKLHWKSPSRPLRSIDRLNVSLLRSDSKSDGTATVRRHQIPGLRQTPFVKIFLLRCDDKESYKEIGRKEVKQWLKSQNVSQDGKSSNKGQERHDAFEYIILHVVQPGTQAAGQPKSSKHITLDASESTDSVNSKSKWTGKSGSTIFDKLRADFSSSSKAPFERVAQVRIAGPEDKQVNGLSPYEIEEQWQDLVEKIKTAILLSFDARVAQYEDDIRDRDSQRHLPGWNFCTFFILKEGLALGFGNMGLIEDALAVYGELDAGLDTLIEEQVLKGDVDPTSALLPFSNDLKPAIRSALDDLSNESKTSESEDTAPSLPIIFDQERENFPFNLDKHNYQSRILTNQASALDFRIYIFTRQLRLLFRQAIQTSAPVQRTNTVGSIGRPKYDLNALANICEKATTFISFAVRALRRDLYAAWGGQEGLSSDELKTQNVVIDSIVTSWKWSATIQILADSQVTNMLESMLTDIEPLSTTAGIARQVDDMTVNGQSKIYNEILSAWTGELLIIARDVLQHEPSARPVDGVKSKTSMLRCIQSPSLRSLLQSKSGASVMVQLLTKYAYQCFTFGSRVNASRLMIYNLAKLQVENDQVDLALFWLERIPQLSRLDAKTAIDRALLDLYARCLRKQCRMDEYAETLTSMLLSSTRSYVPQALPHYDAEVQELLQALAESSEDIKEQSLPFNEIFRIRSLPKNIVHEESQHGFCIFLDLSLRLHAALEIPEVNLTLNAANGQDPSQIVLSNTAPVSVHFRSSLICLSSKVVTEGWYHLAGIDIKIGKISFKHQISRSSPDESTKMSFAQTNPPAILIYPHRKALSMSARPTEIVDLTMPGCLQVQVTTPHDAVDECLLRMRPATAGVRLDIRAADVKESDHWETCEVVRQDDANALKLVQLSPKGKAVIRIPFSTENQFMMVTIKIEAFYKVGENHYSAFHTQSVHVSLPININVQDIFQARKVFSRFTAAPSTSVPLRILRWDVQDNETFHIKFDSSTCAPVDVFPRLPASCVVEVQRKQPDIFIHNKIPLTVQYQKYDDMILDLLHADFRRELQDSSVSFAMELLISHLTARMSDLWSEQELETAVLLQRFEMFSFDRINWQSPLQALQNDQRAETEMWLRKWHEQNQWFDLSSTQASIREVRLSVDIPNPSVIVSTTFMIDEGEKRFATLGEPITTELIISCTSSTTSDVEIAYEVANQTDTWLICGKRRGSFTTTQLTKSFNVVLIPQKTGHVMLPNIDVHYRRLEGSGNTNEFSCEIENKSHGKSVLVSSGFQSSTIALNTDAVSGGYWTIEAKHCP